MRAPRRRAVFAKSRIPRTDLNDERATSKGKSSARKLDARGPSSPRRTNGGNAARSSARRRSRSERWAPPSSERGIANRTGSGPLVIAAPTPALPRFTGEGDIGSVDPPEHPSHAVGHAHALEGGARLGREAADGLAHP